MASRNGPEYTEDETNRCADRVEKMVFRRPPTRPTPLPTQLNAPVAAAPATQRLVKVVADTKYANSIIKAMKV